MGIYFRCNKGTLFRRGTGFTDFTINAWVKERHTLTGESLHVGVHRICRERTRIGNSSLDTLLRKDHLFELRAWNSYLLGVRMMYIYVKFNGDCSRSICP